VSEGRTATTLTGRRCEYCGHRLDWRDAHDRWASTDGACRYHRDLARIQAAMLNPEQYDLPPLRAELREAVQTTKGKRR
jgi:hypothetical protein